MASSHTILFFLAINVAVAAATKMNAVDRCWRGKPNWAANRQRLASCSIGYTGNMKLNLGPNIKWYTVTDPADHPVKPRQGTLRYGATMLQGPVWITFAKDMQINLKRPIIVNSFTTIDGRGADVHITGAGFWLLQVTNVIIHGLHFHHINAHPAGQVMNSSRQVIQISEFDGDAIRLVDSTKIWIDHNTMYQCQDGLVDVTRGSSWTTITNNWFRDHDKVMLLGHDDAFSKDKKMRVTIAFNRFGPNCNQRMPRSYTYFILYNFIKTNYDINEYRIRYGYAHVVNNFYQGWKDYAIGGSASSMVRSEGNIYEAPANSAYKMATVRLGDDGKGSWHWQSVDDAFFNGASFEQNGSGVPKPRYRKHRKITVSKAKDVRELTKNAGALKCHTKARRC